MSSIATAHPPLSQAQHHRLDILAQTAIAIVCVLAGFAPLATRWIPNDAVRIGIGAALAVMFLGFALLARTAHVLAKYSPLAFALFVLAVVQILNNSIPGFVSMSVLHDTPNSGNPFASTISGTVVVQLVEMLITIVPVVVLIKLSGQDLGSIFVQKGNVGKWLFAALAFFVLFYAFTATIPLRPGSVAERLLPTNGSISLAHFFALSPALILVSLSNGVEEEVLFRGLILPKLNAIFNPWAANIVQAAIFSVAHLGVTYTPSALVFIILIVLPLGLAAGYLARATRSLLTPIIFHGALDMAIYLTFLTYAS